MENQSFPCETCKWREKSEMNPGSFWSKLWNWHTKWCPGWKRYQAHLNEQQNNL